MNGLILFCPDERAMPVHYWRVEGGGLVNEGSCQLEDLPIAEDPGAEVYQVMLLIAPEHAVLCWHDMGDMPAKQAESAASLKAREFSAEPDNLHIAAQLQANGQVLTGQVSKPYLRGMLERLAEVGIDPDIILPMALAVPTDDGRFVAGELAGRSILRGDQFASPDEQVFRETIVGDDQISAASPSQIEDCLLEQFSHPQINLRTGSFARKDAGKLITPRQWKILGMLATLALLLSLFLALATLWKYHSAISREDDQALAAVQKINPEISSMEQVEAGGWQPRGSAAGRSSFLQLSAALYSALQDTPSVQLQSLRFDKDQILSFALASPSGENVNLVLKKLQDEGYLITATPRQEATGQSIADITMRLP